MNKAKDELFLNDMIDEEYRIMNSTEDKECRRNCHAWIELFGDQTIPIEERVKGAEHELDYIIENEWSELQ